VSLYIKQIDNLGYAPIRLDRKAIEERLSEADRGELLSHEEVVTEIRAKYKLD